MVDRVQLTKYETAALGGDDADTLPYPAPIAPQEDAIEAAGVYLQDISNRDETTLLSRSGNDMTFKDGNNSGGLTLSQLVRSVSKVGTPANNQLAVWTGDGTLEGESELTYDGTTLTISGNLSSTKAAVAGPITLTEVASADGDVAGKGQVWVKDNTPNDLYFTDDTGVDHLISLTETDYAKLPGRAGGQTLYGGIEASQSLTLGSTPSATKGLIYFGAVGAVDEENTRLGIGTTSPETTVHIKSADSGATPDASYDELFVENSTNAGITIGTGNAAVGALMFADPENNIAGGVVYDHGVDRMYFRTGDAADTSTIKMTIEGVSGDVGIGVSNPQYRFDVREAADLVVNFSSSAASAYSRLMLGNNASGNRYAYFDMMGDDIYANYGFRIVRGNTGENTTTQLVHRGTGNYNILANEAADINFLTDNTVRMTVDGGGNVGIGEQAPLGTLHIRSGDVGSISPMSTADELVIEGSSDSGITIYSGSGSVGALYFADVDDDQVSGINYNHNNGIFSLYVNNGYRMYVTSSYVRVNNVALQIDDASTIIDRDGSNNMTFTDAVTGTKTLADLAASGSGNVAAVPTPVNNQLAVWTGTYTIEGTSDLTFDGSTLTVVGTGDFDNLKVDQLNTSALAVGPNRIRVQASSNSDQFLRFRRGGSPSGAAGVCYSAFDADHWFQHNLAGTLYFAFSSESSDNPDLDNATTKVVFTEGGAVGIGGVTSPAAALHVYDGGSGIGPNSYSNMVVESSNATANYLTMLAPATAINGIMFGDPTNGNQEGRIIYSQADREMTFYTAGGLRLTIDHERITTGGALLVAGTVYPSSTIWDLGTSSAYWRRAYVNTVQLNNLSAFTYTTLGDLSLYYKRPYIDTDEGNPKAVVHNNVKITSNITLSVSTTLDTVGLATIIPNTTPDGTTFRLEVWGYYTSVSDPTPVSPVLGIYYKDDYTVGGDGTHIGTTSCLPVDYSKFHIVLVGTVRSGGIYFSGWTMDGSNYPRMINNLGSTLFTWSKTSGTKEFRLRSGVSSGSFVLNVTHVTLQMQ